MINIDVLSNYVAAAKKQDRDAFTALFQYTKDYTYGIALSFLSDEEEAQDIVQEVYLRVWLHLPDLREDRSFLRWLHSITFNISQDHLQQRALQKKAINSAAEELFLQKSTFDEWMLKSWKQETIHEMVATLPDVQREAVYLFYFQDRTVGEIAAMQNCSINTVKSRLFYARNTLQKLIETEEKRTGEMHLSPTVLALTSVMLLPVLQITLPHAESMRILLSVFAAAESMNGGIACSYTSGDGISKHKPLYRQILSFIRGHWTVHIRSHAVIALIVVAVLCSSGLVLFGRALERRMGSYETDIPEHKQSSAEHTQTHQTSLPSVIAKGMCGAEASYTIDENGVLTISGKGKIGTQDTWRWNELLSGEEQSLFLLEELAPYREFISSVIVEEGITEIGYAAFSRMPNLVMVSLPDSCTVVGAGAFFDCPQLTEIVFPPHVEYIEDVVCKECVSLRRVVISEDAIYIGSEAFNGCSKLESVKFSGNALNEIGGMAFTCLPQLKELHLPDSVAKIGAWAFTEIGVEVLDLSNLKNTVIEMNAIRDCTALKKLLLPESAVRLPSSMVYNCTALREVVIGEGTRAIGRNVFGNAALTEITIPAGVITIEGGAFNELNYLTAVHVDENNPNYCDVDGVLYTRSMDTIHTYPSGQVNPTFILPESVHTIGCYAFANNSQLVTMVINGELNVLSYISFVRMKALTGLYFRAGAPTVWVENAIASCDRLTLYFPDEEQTVVNGEWTAPDGTVFKAKILDFSN